MGGRGEGRLEEQAGKAARPPLAATQHSRARQKRLRRGNSVRASGETTALSELAGRQHPAPSTASASVHHAPGVVGTKQLDAREVRRVHLDHLQGCARKVNPVKCVQSRYTRSCLVDRLRRAPLRNPAHLLPHAVHLHPHGHLATICTPCLEALPAVRKARRADWAGEAKGAGGWHAEAAAPAAGPRATLGTDLAPQAPSRGGLTRGRPE